MPVENVTKTRLNPERGKIKESCCPIQEEINDNPYIITVGGKTLKVAQ